jgi:hypothetical protein
VAKLLPADGTIAAAEMAGLRQVPMWQLYDQAIQFCIEAEEDGGLGIGSGSFVCLL